MTSFYSLGDSYDNDYYSEASNNFQHQRRQIHWKAQLETWV